VTKRDVDGLIPGNAGNSRRFLCDLEPQTPAISRLRNQPRIEGLLRFESKHRQIARGFSHL
jgi:hypothetical protein